MEFCLSYRRTKPSAKNKSDENVVLFCVLQDVLQQQIHLELYKTAMQHCCDNLATIFSFLRGQTESIEVFDIDIKTDQNPIVRIEY